MPYLPSLVYGHWGAGHREQRYGRACLLFAYTWDRGSTPVELEVRLLELIQTLHAVVSERSGTRCRVAGGLAPQRG